jgi:hypothetical protein
MVPEDIRERIGRSPDKGDAVIMAYHEGGRAMRRMVAVKIKNALPDADLGGRVPYHQRFGSRRRDSEIAETSDGGYSDEQGL